MALTDTQIVEHARRRYGITMAIRVRALLDERPSQFQSHVRASLEREAESKPSTRPGDNLWR